MPVPLFNNEINGSHRVLRFTGLRCALLLAGRFAAVLGFTADKAAMVVWVAAVSFTVGFSKRLALL